MEADKARLLFAAMVGANMLSRAAGDAEWVGALKKPVKDAAAQAVAERQRETEAAAAIRARVTKAVELTCARMSAFSNPKFRQAKMARLAEIQASLAAKDPKTLAVSRPRGMRQPSGGVRQIDDGRALGLHK